MKIRITLHSEGNAAALAVHKAVQNHSHGSAKTSTHRYERRKVREYLRHAPFGADDTLAFAE